jgi:hypothetical protein
LEQLAELLDSLLIPVEGSTTNTSSVSIAQLRDFLYNPITTLNVSGSSPSYTLNPAVNSVNKCDLSSINGTDTVNINLPAGLVNKESQIIMKIKNPNLATITVAGLTKRLSMLNLALPNFQLILEYDQAQGAWVGGTLQIESI